jgi:hypothetical protein
MPSTSDSAVTPLRQVSGSGRRKVRTGTDPETIRVLTREVNGGIIPDTYVANGAPVVVEQISGGADPGAGDEDVALPIAASALRPPLLASLLARHAEVFVAKRTRDDRTYEEERTPSQAVLSAVLAPQSWPGLPVLNGIISTPVLRPNGTLLQDPGYDPETGFYLAGNSSLDRIPDRPPPRQVAAAREFLLNRFLRDFPWRSDADRANYIALLVTPLIRPFTRALSPFAMIDATMPSSGKTILSGCVGLLVGQRVLSLPDSDEELRKQITAVFADQVGVVVFDNIAEGTAIDSPVLARLITERVWSDRLLGSNKNVRYPNDRLWVATGNNIHSGGDMASRSVWVRLDPDCPRPEQRSGFSIPNLDTWILDSANRAKVLRALLILILDWTNHGHPVSTEVPAMRQFTTWARHLGGFLTHHNVPGFLDNAEHSRELDESGAEWGAFLTCWHELHGDRRLTAHEVWKSADQANGSTSDPWEGTFPTTSGGKLISPKAVGKRLSGQVGRWRDDVRLLNVFDTHRKIWRYWVEKAG